jgi:hypothetical protein
MSQGTIVIFRIQLLPPSETFIVTQAAAMRRFSPFFVGWRRMAGIELPPAISWTADGGGPGENCRSFAFATWAQPASSSPGCAHGTHGWSTLTLLPMVMRPCSLRNSSAYPW